MPKFITDWKKIGQSGPTIDGRTINPEWLEQAAESYDAAVYTAQIWLDHMTWYGNHGQVRELRAERDGNLVSLYARLQPNDRLLSLNREGQKLFTSMELDLDFAGSGKCYLSGLAVTDVPASLGTHELMFSARKKQERNVIVCGVELDNLRLENEDGAVSRLLGEFARLMKRQPSKPRNEDAMDEKQFTRLLEAVTAQTAAVNTLAEKFNAKGPGTGPEPPAPATEPAPAAPPAPAAEPAGQFADLSTKLDGVIEKFNALEQRMEAQKPGTHTPATTQPAGDDSDVL